MWQPFFCCIGPWARNMSLLAMAFIFVRMDRIGDLILTLPCDQDFKDEKVHWFITNGTGFVLDHARPIRAGIEFQKAFSLSQAYRMFKAIRMIRPQGAVVFHAPWWVSLILFLSRVPLRAGRLSQWHSYLFYNRGVRQKRHLSEKHELEYNLELCQQIKPSLPMPHPLKLAAPTVLNKPWGHQPKSFIVVHPGMGGSALNWPTDFYAQLILKLKKYKQIIITGTKMDEKYLEPLRIALKSEDQITWLDDRLNTQELLALYAESALVIAPSTGVVHIAASLGVPTLGLYSPVRAHRAKRWRPLGAFVQVVEAPPTATHDMRELSVNTVLETALESIK